jgi:hypothetical protein
MRPSPLHLAAIVFAVVLGAAVSAAAIIFLYAFFVTDLHSNWRGRVISIGFLWPFIAVALWFFRAQPALDKHVPNDDAQVHPLVWAWRVVVGVNQR